MNGITLSVEIPPDHHLVLDLPADVPVGHAEIIIMLQPTVYQLPANPAREAARTKLLAAGFLVTDFQIPEGNIPLTPQERLQLGQLPPGSPSIDDLINEDRGSY